MEFLDVILKDSSLLQMGAKYHFSFIKAFSLLIAGLVFLFDETKWKLKFVVYLSLTTGFIQAESINSTILSYELFSFVNIVFSAVLLFELGPKGFLKKIWVSIFFIQTFILGILSLKSLSLMLELNIALFCCFTFSFIPLLYEKINKEKFKLSWAALVFQQYYLRLFILYWCYFYRLELIQIKIFSEIGMGLAIAALFIPFWVGLNWKKIEIRYLSEIFSTLIIFTSLLLGVEQVFEMILISVVGGVFFSLEKLSICSDKIKFSKIVSLLDVGLFFGFSFMINSLLIYSIYKVHFDVGVILGFAMLVFSVMIVLKGFFSTDKDRQIDKKDLVEAESKVKLKDLLKAALHFLFFVMLVVFRKKLGVG